MGMGRGGSSSARRRVLVLRGLKSLVGAAGRIGKVAKSNPTAVLHR
jgi:hypothetical protein